MVKKANIAMYNILKKGRLLNLSIQCHYDLFLYKIVKPVILYGCEIWGFCYFEVIEKAHLKFLLLLKVKKSTQNYIIYLW